jgi:hypothetical protein
MNDAVLSEEDIYYSMMGEWRDIVLQKITVENWHLHKTNEKCNPSINMFNIFVLMVFKNSVKILLWQMWSARNMLKTLPMHVDDLCKGSLQSYIMTNGQSVSLGVRQPSGTCGQFLSFFL